MTAPFTLDPKQSSAGKGRLNVIVTYLEMTTPPAAPPPRKPAGDVAIRRACAPAVAFYRFLYNTVGEPWLWHERRAMTDADLHAAVADPRVELEVLYVDGSPAGYVEIDRRGAKTGPKTGANGDAGGRSNVVDLAYFGLLPEYIGRGLGVWLLREGIDRAWKGGAVKLTVNTCTFDHPSALGIYQSMGFKPVRHASYNIADPRVHGRLPRDAGRHIPINE